MKTPRFNELDPMRTPLPMGLARATSGKFLPLEARAAAKDAGVKFYIGASCKRCGETQRYTKTANCVRCAKFAALEYTNWALAYKP